MITIWHNNRCGTSRKVLEILREKGVAHWVVNYLEAPPMLNEIEEVIKKAGIKAHDLIRTEEAAYKPYKNQTLTEEQWVRVMADAPILIQRPVVINGNKAVIARPPERVLEIL